MRRIIFASCVFLGLGFASAASAASFDCAKAKSRSEVLVCQTPQLSQLDEQLAQTYKADLAVSPTPVGLTLSQRQWMAERDKGESTGEAGKFRPYTADEMANDYQGRIADLKAEIDLAAKAQAPFPLADLAKRCAPLTIDTAKCVVVQSGQVKGSATLGPLWYQLQGPPDGDTDDFTRGVVVFQAAGPGQLRARMWNFLEGSYFDAPELIQTSAGRLLWLPATDDGTGVFNEDLLYRWADTRWRDIDLQSWKDDLARRLPKDRQVWKGVPYDFAHLQATTHLWVPDDGNCCPTGGKAKVTFKLAGDKLEIVSVKRSASNDD